MSVRIDYTRRADAAPLQAMSALSGYLETAGLDAGLRQLLELRISQLNGCAYCVDMHTKDLRAGGETELRIALLPVWHEADVYSDAERAALAWAEALTRIQAGDDLSHAYAALGPHYSEAEILQLVFTVIAINSWNRLNIACASPAGSYKPGDHEARLLGALRRLTG